MSEISVKQKNQDSSSDEFQKDNQPAKKSKKSNNQQKQDSHFEQNHKSLTSKQHQHFAPKLISPYFQQYKTKFVRNRQVENYRKYIAKFIPFNISRRKSYLPQHHTKIKLVSRSRNNRIIHYDVRLSYFSIKIKILNLVSQDNFKFKTINQIDEGVYGSVFEAKLFESKFAVKKITMKEINLERIEEVIKQYAFMKLMAAIQCGPNIQYLFGFDIVLNQNSFYFSCERCLEVSKFIQTLNNQLEFEEKFQSLEHQLLLMHSLNICHNDIKPSNIVYSFSLDKLVFVDFGLTEIYQQALGQMKYAKAKGSFYYSCDDMKNAFVSDSGKGIVDLYYNDYIGLQKTKEVLFQKVIQNSQQLKKHYFFYKAQQPFQIQHLNRNVDLSSFQNFLCEKINFQQIVKQQQIETDYFAILLIFLISESQINPISSLLLKKQKYLKIAEQKFILFYWIFLEINYNISVQFTYKKLKSLLLQTNIISCETKFIIEKILDPYFLKAINGNIQKNQPYIEYMNIQIRNKYKISQKFELILYQIDAPIFRTNLSPNLNNERLSRDLIFDLSQKQYLTPESNSNQQHKTTFMEINIQNFHKTQKHKILQLFCNIEMAQFIQIVDTINQKLFQIQPVSQMNRQNINTFQRCFLKAGINVINNSGQDTELNHSQKNLLWIEMLIDIKTHVLKKIFNKKLLFQESQINQNWNSNKNNFQFQRINTRNYNSAENHKFLQYLKNFLESQKALIQSEASKKILLLLIRLLKIFTLNTSYIEGKAKNDSIMQILSEKIQQIFELRALIVEENNQVYLFRKIKYILDQFINALYQIGIHIMLTSESFGDIERLIHYYNILFNSNNYLKKWNNEGKLINYLSYQPYFYLLRDIFSLIIFRKSIPKSLRRKFQISKKAQGLLKQIEWKSFFVEIYTLKNLKEVIFSQYIFALIQQHQYLLGMDQLNKLLSGQQSLWTAEMFQFLLIFYEKTNNNKKIQFLRKKIKKLNHACFEGSRIYIQLEQILNQQRKSQCCRSIKNKNQSREEELFQSFINLVNFSQFQLDNDLRLHYLVQFMRQSVLIPESKQKYLRFYIQKYKHLLLQQQKYIHKKIQYFSSLYMHYNIFQYSTAELKMKKQNRSNKIDLKINHNLFQNYLTKQSFILQNQFWKQIERQWVFQNRIHFLDNLISVHQKIQQKNIIFNEWLEIQQKVKTYSPKYPARYFQMQFKIYQVKYIQSLNNNRTELVFYYEMLVKSCQVYLENFLLERNDFYGYEQSISMFYPDLLLNIYNQNIKIKDFDKKRTEQLIKLLFNEIIKLNQIFQFFINNQVYEKLINVFIKIGIEEIHAISKSQNTNLHQKTIFNLQNNHRPVQVNRLFIFALFKQIGSFVDRYKCQNYFKTLFKLSRYLINTFINYPQIKDTIYIVQILNQIFAKLILKNKISSLVLIIIEVNYFLIQNYHISSFEIFDIIFKNSRKIFLNAIKKNIYSMEYFHIIQNVIRLYLHIYTILKQNQQFSVQRKILFFNLKLFRHFIKIEDPLGKQQNVSSSPQIQSEILFNTNFKKIIFPQGHNHQKSITESNQFALGIKRKILKRLQNVL